MNKDPFINKLIGEPWPTRMSRGARSAAKAMMAILFVGGDALIIWAFMRSPLDALICTAGCACLWFAGNVSENLRNK